MAGKGVNGGVNGWTLITGASEGLGREFAIIAAAEGRDLILAGWVVAAMNLGVAVHTAATLGIENAVLGNQRQCRTRARPVAWG